MQPIKLHEHLNKMHPEHREKPLEHFKCLRDKTSKTQEKSLDSMFKANTSMQERGLQVGYELSFLLAQEYPTPHQRRGCAEACPGDLPQNDAEQKKKTAAQELPQCHSATTLFAGASITSQTIWRSSWSPSSGQPSFSWPSTNPPSATVKRFYSLTPDFT